MIGAVLLALVTILQCPDEKKAKGECFVPPVFRIPKAPLPKDLKKDPRIEDRGRPSGSVKIPATLPSGIGNKP